MSNIEEKVTVKYYHHKPWLVYGDGREPHKTDELGEYHESSNTWELLSDLYCPQCGTRGYLWGEIAGDMEAGPNHICTDCEHLMRWMEPYSIPEDIKNTDRQAVNQLKRWEK